VTRGRACALAVTAAVIVACGPKKPPEGPPPEYEPGREWTPDGKPLPRGSAAPAASAAPSAERPDRPQ